MSGPESSGTAPIASDGGPGPGDPGADDAVFPTWVRDILRCPVTGAPLTDGVGPDGTPELHSADPDRPLAYPVRDGIPVLLEQDARPL